MANTPRADGERRLEERPSHVRVTVVRLADDRGIRKQRLYVRVALAGAGVAALVAIALGGGGTAPGAAAGVRDGGPAGVAAAFGYPPSCLTVRISAAANLARADFDRGRSCGFRSSFPTAIFRRFGGEWHPVLYTVGDPCLVPSVPSTGQAELTLCPQRR